ncbi:MAG: hypothetical protein AAB394_00315 [Patescibacteria group bacterium]
MKPRFVVDVSKEKVFLSLKKTKKVLREKYLGEVNVGIVASGKNQFL